MSRAEAKKRIAQLYGAVGAMPEGFAIGLRGSTAPSNGPTSFRRGDLRIKSTPHIVELFFNNLDDAAPRTLHLRLSTEALGLPLMAPAAYICPPPKSRRWKSHPSPELQIICNGVQAAPIHGRLALLELALDGQAQVARLAAIFEMTMGVGDVLQGFVIKTS